MHSSGLEGTEAVPRLPVKKILLSMGLDEAERERAGVLAPLRETRPSLMRQRNKGSVGQGHGQVGLEKVVVADQRYMLLRPCCHTRHGLGEAGADRFLPLAVLDGPVGRQSAVLSEHLAPIALREHRPTQERVCAVARHTAVLHDAWHELARHIGAECVIRSMHAPAERRDHHQLRRSVRHEIRGAANLACLLHAMRRQHCVIYKVAGGCDVVLAEAVANHKDYLQPRHPVRGIRCGVHVYQAGFRAGTMT
eukprot:scaffold263_cov120-Isochrysis_galbana.AAC.1